MKESPSRLACFNSVDEGSASEVDLNQRKHTTGFTSLWGRNMPSLLPTADTNVKEETSRNYIEGLSCIKACLCRMRVSACMNVMWCVCVCGVLTFI